MARRPFFLSPVRPGAGVVEVGSRKGIIPGLLVLPVTVEVERRWGVKPGEDVVGGLVPVDKR